MTKKFFSLILTFVCIFTYSAAAYAEDEILTPASPITVTELSSVFPEMEVLLSSMPNNDNSSQARIFGGTREPVFAERRLADEHTEYSLVIYSDQTYQAARFSSTASLTGGTTITNPALSQRANATLSIKDNTVGATKYFLISSLTYTINYNGYDKLNSISNVITATIEENGSLKPYSNGINSHKVDETASYPAYGSYYIASSYIEFQVGNDSWRVLMDGSYL